MGVDAVKVFGWQCGKTRAPIQGLSMCWGFFVFTPFEGDHRMPAMPDRPESWAKFWEAMSNPLLQGAIMAILISLLRVLYDAKETSKRRIIFEALICGGLSLSASSVIAWMEWPSNLSVAAGGAIGFLGVTAIREMVTRFLGRKVDSL